MRLAADTVIAGLRGAAIGVIVGYFVHTAYHSGDEALFELARFQAVWALLGGVLGLGAGYLIRFAATGR